jgi:predicted ribosome quality control (RQC) complex YloA/Tae2 family protein
MRAHVVGRTVREATVDEQARVVLVCDGEPAVRVLLRAGRGGDIVVEAADAVVRWPLRSGELSHRAADLGDLAAAGAVLVDQSDAAVEAGLRVALRRALSRRRAAVARRVAAITGDLARVAEADDLERVARLLVAQAGKIPRGAVQAELDDWERGTTLSVTLDPALPARAQAEALFAKARRFRRGKPMTEARLASSRAELASIESVIALLVEVPAGGSLEEPTRRAADLGVRVAESSGAADPVRPVRRAAGAHDDERRPFHVYRVSDERRVLVGRGAGDNDALTTRYARPHDLWLHAKGRTGAHVVVPLDKGEACPPQVLVDAATLAAHFSDARGETSCEVSHVPRRYVRKRKGSPPGAVTLDREKVITLRLEPARLARLLRSRED